MRFPDTMQAKVEELDEEGWNCLKSAIEKALSDVDAFRIQEGKVLIADILKRIELIKSLSGEVPQFEKQRVVTIKPVSYTHLLGRLRGKNGERELGFGSNLSYHGCHRLSERSGLIKIDPHILWDHCRIPRGAFLL